MPMVFSLEAYLHLLVFIQDPLVIVDEAFKPLEKCDQLGELKIGVKLTFSIP